MNTNSTIASRIVGRYRIIYNNGMSQEKDLISQSDFEQIIKVKQEEIYVLEKENNNKPSNKSKALKQELKQMFGDNYFTDGSPLFKASITGVLSLPKTQGGDSKCQIIKI